MWRVTFTIMRQNPLALLSAAPRPSLERCPDSETPSCTGSGGISRGGNQWPYDTALCVHLVCCFQKCCVSCLQPSRCLCVRACVLGQLPLCSDRRTRLPAELGKGLPEPPKLALGVIRLCEPSSTFVGTFSSLPPQTFCGLRHCSSKGHEHHMHPQTLPAS